MRYFGSDSAWHDLGLVSNTDLSVFTVDIDDVYQDASYYRVRVGCDDSYAASTYTYVDAIFVHIVGLDVEDGYGESFADVSDWSTLQFESEDSYSTDGDLLVFSQYGNGQDDNDYVYSDAPSLTGSYYLEFRYRVSTTGIDRVQAAVYTGDGMTGSNQYFTITSLSTSWTTYKGYISSVNTIECVVIAARKDSGVSVTLYVDYIRIAPADQMGWQHDGSTTAGVTLAGGASVSSDGDLLNISNDATTSNAEYTVIYVDSTNTKSAISMTY